MILVFNEPDIIKTLNPIN